ncbi:MAG: translation initiation factor IF-2 [Syntrophales bacterium]|jgi:translation initiation factor IF-2
MTKKRVYEVARELGVDNKDLIARLAKIGIAVKSHSSTLEDSDIERIHREFSASGARETVEKRIKSTVIRRRSVVVPAEEQPPEPEKAEVKEEAMPSQPQARQPAESRPVTGAKQAEPVSPVQPEEEVEKKGPPLRKPVIVSPPPPSMEKRGSGEPKPAARIPEAPSEASTRPSKEITKAAPPMMERKAAQHSAPKGPAPDLRKEIPKKPDLKIIRGAAVPAPETPSPRPEADKFKKKGKKPVEVLIIDETPSRKKVISKKSTDKREWREDADSEERAGKWREDKRSAAAKMKKTLITIPKAIKRRIRVMESITVGDLAKKMGAKASELINKLMGMGMMVTINQSIDFDAATLIASEFGYQVEQVTPEYEEVVKMMEKPSKNLLPRAPVVTIMGHVDHGKTSLLDAIRQTNVIDGEAGGITQAIGAYHVRIKDRDIVFLDTPGHEAFTAMRARGAQVTDIVILVVAADDGVMDQTVEAINHSRVAGVPIIVAVNKIDKPNADPEKIKRGLSDYNLMPEEWGGDTIYSEVSAKKKTGIEELLEMILLQADVLELKADPGRPARGVIIESKLDRGRGPVATVLIQEGTLHEGDDFVAKSEYGRVRAMINDQGQRVHEAGPSIPVEVIGFSNVPQVSTQFLVVEDDKKARSMADYWFRKERQRELSASAKITLEQLYERIKEGVKEFNVILKGDVQGSIEALSEALGRLSTQDIKLKIIHSSTGAITETDVMLASASNALIIGFNVRPEGRVVEIAEKEGVEIKLYDIIYNVIADVRAGMEGLLEPEFRENVVGRAEVRELFRVPKIGTISGSYVLDGKMMRSALVRLIRDGVVIYDGKIGSLRRFKDDAREVAAGFECGIGIENYNDIQVGDIIEAYVKEQIERKL